MKRNLVPLMSLLLIAAFSNPFSNGKISSVSDVSGASARTALGTEVKPSATAPIIPRTDLGPWIASCKFFPGVGDRSAAVQLDLDEPYEPQVADLSNRTSGSTQGRVPSIMQPTRWCVDPGYSFEFLIATVPDPINSHLALDSDRRIEAIQWAAQDDNYLNDSFWLPWDFEESTEKDSTKRTEKIVLRQIRDQQPGLQIFSHRQHQPVEGEGSPNTALFVFFVAETPTMGVNKNQLSNALHYIQEIASASKLKSPPSEISILGPCFSGSVSSLKTVLSTFPSTKFRIISGSATDHDSLEGLRHGQPNIDLKVVLHDDQVALTTFLHTYVHDKLYLEMNRVALISESETAYGSSIDSWQDPHGTGYPIRIRFPREISALRNAYPDQPNLLGRTDRPQGRPRTRSATKFEGNAREYRRYSLHVQGTATNVAGSCPC